MQHATFNADDLPVTSYASRLHPTTLYIELHITISRLLPTVFLDGTSLRIVGSTAHCTPSILKSRGFDSANHRSYLLSSTASAATDSCAPVLDRNSLLPYDAFAYYSLLQALPAGPGWPF